MKRTYSRVVVWSLGVLMIFAVTFLQPVRAENCTPEGRGDAVAYQRVCEPSVSAEDHFTDVASASAVQTDGDNDAQNAWTIMGGLIIVFGLIVLVSRSGRRSRVVVESSNDM